MISGQWAGFVTQVVGDTELIIGRDESSSLLMKADTQGA